MCCLFGLIDYAHRLSGRQKTRILYTLSVECEARGTDATGYAYNAGDELHIFKKPLPARKVHPYIPSEAQVIMGHTRMTTQGSANYLPNNHPFKGHLSNRWNSSFALAHNGVIYNDKVLRESYRLPRTGIETDSYVAVQLLERGWELTPWNLKYMAQAIKGSFVFTILDDRDNFYLVRGDNPICLYHFPELGLYLYASTKPILESGLRKSWLACEEKEEVPVAHGEILHINPRGTRKSSYFEIADPCPLCNYRHTSSYRLPPPEDSYLEELKTLSYGFGYTPEDVEALLKEGFTTDEIEELFYLGRI